LIQDSQSGVTTSVYNGANLLVTQLYGGSGQTPLRVDLTYNQNEQVATISRYSNLAATVTVGTTSYSYDANHRLTSIQDRNSSGTLIANFTYTYDKADRVTTEDLNGSTTTYGYDTLSELTSVATSAGTQTYSYDANGNPTDTGDVIGTGNQLTNDGTWTYTYDNAGNLTEKSQGPSGLTWMYTYDNRNEMLTAEELSSPGGTVLSLSTYTYDLFGNQLSANQTNGGVTTVTHLAYLDPGGNNGAPVVWAYLNGSNQLVTRELYLPGQTTPYARISSGGTAAWYLTDWEGSVRFMTDNTGAVQDQITYSGFGAVTNETSPTFGDEYKYTGGRLDPVTGLQVNWWRQYNSATGTWETQDPLGLTQGPNPYEYVGNDPTNWTDPTGTIPSNAQAEDAYWTARYVLEFKSPAKNKQAVELLESQLANVDGDKDYLDLLRQAYQAYIQDLVNQGNITEAQKYLGRLGILSPGAKLPDTPKEQIRENQPFTYGSAWYKWSNSRLYYYANGSWVPTTAPGWSPPGGEWQPDPPFKANGGWTWYYHTPGRQWYLIPPQNWVQPSQPPRPLPPPPQASGPQPTEPGKEPLIIIPPIGNSATDDFRRAYEELRRGLPIFFPSLDDLQLEQTPRPIFGQPFVPDPADQRKKNKDPKVVVPIFQWDYYPYYYCPPSR